MIFRQLVDLRSSTCTYLLADQRTREAVLIDPVLETFPRDAALVRELSLTLLYTLEMHVHGCVSREPQWRNDPVAEPRPSGGTGARPACVIRLTPITAPHAPFGPLP